MSVHAIDSVLVRDRHEVDEILTEAAEQAREINANEVVVILVEPSGELRIKYTDKASPSMIGGLQITQSILIEELLGRE